MAHLYRYVCSTIASAKEQWCLFQWWKAPHSPGLDILLAHQEKSVGTSYNESSDEDAQICAILRLCTKSLN